MLIIVTLKKNTKADNAVYKRPQPPLNAPGQLSKITKKGTDRL